MGTFDDIMGGGNKIKSTTSPVTPPIDSQLQGAPNHVRLNVENPAKTSIQSNMPDEMESLHKDDTKQPVTPVKNFQQTIATDTSKHLQNIGIRTFAPHKTPDENANLSYSQLFEKFFPNKPETPEEKIKREKKEKQQKIFSAIGDGISALSNLFFTTKYAPDSYDASNSMSAQTRARLDKLRAEREANDRAYYDGYIRARVLDEQKNREDRNWQHTIEREKIADKRYEAQAKRDEEMADLNAKLKGHQITAAEYKAQQEEIKAKFAEQSEMLDLGYKQAGIKQRRAAAGASSASAKASHAKADYYRGGGSGGGKKGPTLQLEDDEPMRFGDDKDYDRAVMRLAPDYGVPTTTIEVLEYDYKQKPKKQRTVKRDVKDIAADIEREAAKRKSEKSQGGKGKGYGDSNSNNGKGKGY